MTTVAVTVRAFLLPIAQHFRDLGWRVDAMASGIVSDPHCRPVFDQVWDANWSRKPWELQSLSMLNQIRTLVAKQEYDIVHVHTPIASFLSRLALQRLRRTRGLRVIYTAHGFHFHSGGSAMRNRVFEALERKAACWTDFLVVMNQEDLRAAEDKCLIEPHRLCFMPGIGLNRRLYSRASVPDAAVEQLYSELQVPQAAPLLLVLAEFTKRKRHEDAIRAFAKIEHKDARLLLSGEGPLLGRMQQLTDQLGIADRVIFLGSRKDVPVLLKASRALILPSSQEGLPRSIIEALSMGLPVIGSRIRGITDLLSENAGLLFDVGDVDGLARAMHCLLSDRSVAAAMAERGLQQSAKYDLVHILRLHEQLYKAALGQECAAA